MRWTRPKKAAFKRKKSGPTGYHHSTSASLRQSSAANVIANAVRRAGRQNRARRRITQFQRDLNAQSRARANRSRDRVYANALRGGNYNRARVIRPYTQSHNMGSLFKR
jgi:hypothetical protein